MHLSNYSKSYELIWGVLMKRFESVVLNLLAVAVVCFVFVLLISSDASAQSVTDGSTPLGLSPGAPAGAYSLSDFDSVNPYNGNLGFRLPLVKIAGRGGAGYTMSARIELKWLVDKEVQPGQPDLFAELFLRFGWTRKDDDLPFRPYRHLQL